MSRFDVEDLKSILQEVASEKSAALEGDVLDVPFCDLGYDSLAVIQVMSEIENVQNVKLPDSALGQMRTPRDALEYVRGLAGSDPDASGC